MVSYDSIENAIESLDQLSNTLAAAQDMTIYHGFKRGERTPYEQGLGLLDNIQTEASRLRDELLQFQDQEEGSSLIMLCTTYSNRLIQNAELLRDITQKLKRFADGGPKYGFWKFRKDSKVWKQNIAKLVNVRSNVALFLRNSEAW
jgi:hypothetical protein